MPDDKERRPFGFLRRFLRRLCGGFGGLFHLAACFQRLCILLFNALLLPKPGNRVRVRKGGVIMQRLLIEKIGVCLCCLFLGCCRRPVRFQLMAAYAAFYRPRRHAARFLAHKFYPVSAFHTDIFFLYLIDFSMYGGVQFLRRTG